jgi:vacuolar-type H+-ATPase subunit E/Vma4
MLNNIEILSRVIMDDASREAEAILDKARKEFESIREEGFRRAEGLKKTAMKSKGQIDLLCDKAKMVSLAEFQARSEILGRKEAIIKEVLQEIQKVFFALPGRKDYPEILKKLTHQALKYLEADGNEFICRVNERDHSLLSSSILKDLGEKMDKLLSLDKSPVDIVGGIIVFRSDLRVLYDNSLEAIFERNRQQMRCIAAESIFGEELGR